MVFLSSLKSFAKDRAGAISIDGLLAAAVTAVIASSSASWSAGPGEAAYVDTNGQYTSANCISVELSNTCG